jgi:hypothetical protein
LTNIVCIGYFIKRIINISAFRVDRIAVSIIEVKLR